MTWYYKFINKISINENERTNTKNKNKENIRK